MRFGVLYTITERFHQLDILVHKLLKGKRRVVLSASLKMKFNSKQHVYIEEKLQIKKDTVSVSFENIAKALIELRKESKIDAVQLEETLMTLRADPAGNIKWDTFIKDCCMSLTQIMVRFNATTLVTKILTYIPPKPKSKMQRACQKFYGGYIPSAVRACPAFTQATRKTKEMLLTEPPGATSKAAVTWYRLKALPYEGWLAQSKDYCPLLCHTGGLIYKSEHKTTNGDSVWGTWKKDVGMHGLARVVLQDGGIIEAQYRDNDKHGYFRYIKANGRAEVGHYKDGKYFGEWHFYLADGKLEAHYLIDKYRNWNKVEE